MGALSDSYCTPKWLADRLGKFDTDPCSNDRSHIKATSKYIIENGSDGLNLPWFGRVWLNHPYSNPLPWIRKLNEQRVKGNCKESLVLAKLDTSTKWWAALTVGDFDLWTFRQRIQFDPPPGIEPSSNNFCSAIVHHGGNRLDLHDVAQLWHNIK